MLVAFYIVMCLDGWSNERMQMRSYICTLAGTYIQLSEKGSF